MSFGLGYGTEPMFGLMDAVAPRRWPWPVQYTREVWPGAMVAGFAVRVQEKPEVPTVTTALFWILPPGPVQFMVKVVDWVRLVIF